MDSVSRNWNFSVVAVMCGFLLTWTSHCVNAAPAQDFANLDLDNGYYLEPVLPESRQSPLSLGGLGGGSAGLLQGGGLGQQQQQQLLMSQGQFGGLQQGSFSDPTGQQQQLQQLMGLQQLQQVAALQQQQQQQMQQAAFQQQLGLGQQQGGFGAGQLGGAGLQQLGLGFGQQQQDPQLAALLSPSFGLQQQLAAGGGGAGMVPGGLSSFAPGGAGLLGLGQGQQSLFPQMMGFGGQSPLFFRSASDKEETEKEGGGDVNVRTKRASLTVRVDPSDTPQIKFSGGGGVILPRTPKVRDFLIRLYILAQSLGYAA